MPNHRHRFRAALLVKMASICILFALSGCGGSDDPEPSMQFTLSGQVNRSGTFTRTDLQTFPPTTQSQCPVPGSFTGVSLWTLLTDANGGGGITTNPQVQNDSLSNPGTLLVPVGVKLFPLKGHEITGWYTYRGMINTNLLEIAFNQPAGSIRKTQYHELAGYWQWTLNPYFDIRLAGAIGLPGGGYRDLAHLANCNPNAASPPVSCSGNDVALTGEARFRARF